MGNTYKTYDPNEDYKKKMDEAAAKGDYASAARYEQQRNDKIKGEGLTQYQPTSQYAQYLPKNQHTGYTPYDPSGSVAQAQQMLNQAMAQKPGAYKSTWQGQMDQLMEQILNRKPFEYDMNSDAMYQQLRDQYMEQGSLAMEDAMGKAAALTGGYGNSYANVAGHQAYQGYMDKLNDRVPELYQMALDRYLAEGQGMMDKYSLMAAGDERDYGRYQDTLSRYYTDFGLAQDQYNDERTWQYQLGRDQIEDERYMQQLQMSQENDQRNQAYELAMSMLQSGMMPSEAVLNASGLSTEDAQKIYDYSKLSMEGSSGGGGGGYYSSRTELKTLSKSDMEELRDLFNEGSKKNDLNAFYNQKSLLAALGYDVSVFDDWAGQEYDGYNSQKPQGVTYSKYGVEDISDVLRKISTSSKEDVIAMMNDIAVDFTEEQWAMIEPLLIKRGIFG